MEDTKRTGIKRKTDKNAGSEHVSLTPAEKIKEITDKLEKGISDLFESDRYMKYLKVMSKLHNYSFNNSLLIAMQRPDATMVAGYTSWKVNFHRNVNKGEKGIKILAPAPYKINKDIEKIDPLTQKPILGKDGKPIKERVQVIVPAYKVTTVFDVSQTSGEKIPEITTELKGDVKEYDQFYEAIKRTSPVPIEFRQIHDGANGYYHLQDKIIAIREGMSQMQNIKTAIHELSHAMLHDKDNGIEKENLPDSRTKEVEAESIAYTVCQHYGIDTSEYSFGYIAGWSSGKELDELKNSMNTIRSTASEIIKGIDKEINLIKEDEKISQLAIDIESTLKKYKFYDDKRMNCGAIKKDIQESNVKDVQKWLDSIPKSKEYSEDVEKAADISEKLKAYSFNMKKEVISEKEQLLGGIEKENSVLKIHHRSHR